MNDKKKPSKRSKTSNLFKQLLHLIDRYYSLLVLVGVLLSIAGFYYFYGRIASTVRSNSEAINRLSSQESQKIRAEIEMLNRKLEKNAKLAHEIQVRLQEKGFNVYRELLLSKEAIPIFSFRDGMLYYYTKEDEIKANYIQHLLSTQLRLILEMKPNSHNAKRHYDIWILGYH